MNETALDGLREQLRGQLVTPSDPDYDSARAVYNGMIDRHPAGVVRVAQVADVIASVNFARDNSLPLAIRGGGHSAPGFGTWDDALVIDFVNRTGVRVDPEAGTARAEAGTTWADFNRATHAFGLATTGGIVGSTGIAGLTLGGGIGYLARKYGLSCDNLISADVVTADGTFLVASETQNEDLFWALRGGGGNFGVVTSFEYKLHPVDMVHVAIILYGMEHAETVVKFYRDYMETAPEEFGTFVGFHQGPPVPFLPEEWHGKPVCVVIGMWTGDPAEGAARWQPFLDVAPVAGSLVGPMPYPALNSAFDPLLPKGMQAYWKAYFLPELNDGATAAHLEYGSKVPSVQTSVHVYPIDGAVQRVAKTDTAFANRDVRFSPVIACMWNDPADNEANIDWVRSYAAALRPHSSPAGYIGFMDGDDQGRIRENYGVNYERLQSIKGKYDPGNLFHVNQNIKPA
ncbi:FAD-binding oxidoreductase [Arthrobacter bambusae]|uniref:FAD-binding oxidoreductase n=1 Tax=Arthrobacter bambusae TaxID=1338426 RepID=UPI002787FBA7|nr:FAD-binding oxidoreductase [Arthrobacter bambusae]MDQ0029127.1 FAD/FMN-containing dehydrogenase [Arthrobacter bambusae]MDQ0098036.1 FAD/FMN-containing dehydrogenase [Arthrobacter bambusae]